MTPSTVELIRYGGTPRSSKRVIAVGASLVCSDDSTRCPVSAACTAMSAVSRSRISPTMMMSGSWRSSVRTPLAKSTPMIGCTCIWLNSGAIISIGSSIEQTLTSSVARSFIVEYSVVVLPEPVGPGDQDDPVRLLDHLVPALAILVAEAELLEVAHQYFGCEDAHDDLFAESRRHGRDAQLDLPARGRHRLDASVLRTAPLDDLHARQELDAAGHRQQHRDRNRVDLVQDAVDAETHDAKVAPRLDVDVGSALLEGVLPQPVDDVDDVLVVGVEIAAVAELDQLLEIARQRDLAPRRLLRLFHRPGEGEELADVAADVLRIGEDELDSAVQDLLELVGPRAHERLAGRDRQHARWSPPPAGCGSARRRRWTWSA